ncbi:response regulator [Hylemonella gracilis]|uniref:Response regulator n=1 Tax=Hylemonella gracilis TaxID=80880 RepID=A0A4P6UI54_9BURK|nr:ATP-binding protein [Hylemonella gracilis]QBK03695.1 response regulator [Hylemonella gracilis]
MQQFSRPPTIQLLHLEDSTLDHDIVRQALRRAGLVCELTRVESLDSFVQALGREHYDAVLADYRLPGFTALDAWQAMQGIPELRRIPPFILLSGAIGEAAAVNAIQLGMSDYLLKDDLGKLAHVIQRAMEVRQAQRERELAVEDLAASEQRLARFAEHLQSSIEQERAAIAREIHDDIGGSLAAIQFDLSWISRHHTDPETLAHVQAATDMLRHAIGASQRIMMNLRPAILDQGLYAAIDWLAREFERRTGIRTALRATLSHPDMRRDIQLTAYRTAQEALTNISKHARCSEAHIDLSDAEDVLTLEIADNGQGIAAEERDKPRSFGLKGLQERARTVGGWLDISSRTGTGTSITLSIPLSPQGHPGPMEEA